MMNSPPKKRAHTPSIAKWGGGIPIASVNSLPRPSVTIQTPNQSHVSHAESKSS
jgi:hypothetical protein